MATADTTAPASQPQNESRPQNRVRSHWLKWGLVGLIGLINLYVVVMMYAQGETVFALITLVLVGTGLYVFANEKTYVHRYVFPGVATMFIFILFPLAYTVWIAFTNYSAANILTFDRAKAYQLSQSYRLEGQNYKFGLYDAGTNQYRLLLTSGDGEQFSSDAIALQLPSAATNADAAKAPIDVDLTPADAAPAEKPVSVKDVVKLRGVLQNVVAHLPDGTDLRMSGIRDFSALRSLYQVLPAAQGGDGETLVNQRTGERISPDFESGFFRPVNDAGEFTGNGIAPGFSVFVGWKNFLRVLTDPGVQGPFIQIFTWTMIFSLLSVLLTLAIGTVLAALVQWEALRGRGIYRLLLILPYAVPAFISILIFRGLFNENFGEINMLLGMFGLSPSWFNDPFTAKVMLVIVNTWLGYPYMMILSMGLLKAIPQDLYEASYNRGAW